MELGGLIEMSRRYGSDANYVLAGGGNTSYKEPAGAGEVMAVKASGTALGDIDEDGFVLMDAGKLRDMTKKAYPDSDDEREACAIKDMMDARMEGQGDKRPSVECILHALFPQPYVLHVHPAIINGVTCGKYGFEAASSLFFDRYNELLWMPLTKPGYILSKVCADAFEEHRESYEEYPSMLLLQNHGIFIAGETVEEIDASMEYIISRISQNVARKPDFSHVTLAAFPSGGQKGTFVCPEPDEDDYAPREGDPADADKIESVASALKAAYGEGDMAFASFQRYVEILLLTEYESAAAPLMQPFTPDHIVYDKAYPLWIPKSCIGGVAGTYTGDGRAAVDAEAIGARFAEFVEKNAFKPKVVLVERLGAFTLGSSAYEADTAGALLMDAVRIATYSESFGGPRALPEDFIKFILNWEIESYRQKKSFG